MVLLFITMVMTFMEILVLQFIYLGLNLGNQEVLKAQLLLFS
jgi:hypothetical protein